MDYSCGYYSYKRNNWEVSFTNIVKSRDCWLLTSAEARGHKSPIPSATLHTGLQPALRLFSHLTKEAACVHVGNTNAHIRKPLAMRQNHFFRPTQSSTSVMCTCVMPERCRQGQIPLYGISYECRSKSCLFCWQQQLERKATVMWPDARVTFLYFRPHEQPTGGFADTSTAFGCGTTEDNGQE